MAKNLAAVIPRANAQLELQERPIPSPGKGQVLVRNHAVAVNPVEWKIQDYGYIVNTYPNVLGSDVAGVVEAVGEGVTYSVKKGDRVLGYACSIGTQNIDEGGFQTYSLLQQHAMTKVPDGMSFEDASTLPMAVATTADGFYEVLGIKRPQGGNVDTQTHQGKALLVYGASSSVGALAVQMAHRLGFTVHAVASGTHKAMVEKLGAKHFYDRSHYSGDEQFADAVVANLEKDGSTHAYGFDAIGMDETRQKIYAAFAKAQKLIQGKIKVASTLPGAAAQPKPDNVEIGDILAFRCFVGEAQVGKLVFNEYLEKALVDGTIVPAPPVRIVKGGLASTQEAWNLNKAGVSGQKLVIQVQ